jgi:aminopeptidase
MYHPSQNILKKYADLLVNFALGQDEGINEGEVVHLNAREAAKPLYTEVRKAVTKAGGHVISNYKPNEGTKYYPKRDFFTHASEDQLDFFPHDYYKSLADITDHRIGIVSEVDKEALTNVDPQKIMQNKQAKKPFLDWMMGKIDRGEATRTVALYGTEAMAEEVGVSQKEYWQEIIHACYLDADDPKAEWRSIVEKLQETKERLDDLDIESIHVESESTDLKVKIGDRRAWVVSTGDNMPSYEVFTAPDWRGTEGVFQATQPLYHYGNLIEGIELTFEYGEVVKASASRNEAMLKEIIATDGASKVGEFSLTDKRLSRISEFMGTTLFDENVGAKHGNTHIAVGRAYKDCFAGDPSKLSDDKWEKLGFNDSAVHTDIVSTEPRTATATLKGGSEKVIYENGEFQV